MKQLEFNGKFVDGQITCPECGEIFFERGEIGGRLRWICSHGECGGAGARVPLEELSDQKAMIERGEYYTLLSIFSPI